MTADLCATCGEPVGEEPHTVDTESHHEACCPCGGAQ